MSPFGRKRKRKQQRDPPGIMFLQMFLDDVADGRIPKEASVQFLQEALTAIVEHEVDPAVALALIPSPQSRFFTPAEDTANAAHHRVLLEVLPTWFFFSDHFHKAQMKEGQFGARKSAVAAAALKFSKSKRVIDRFFSAYKSYYNKWALLAKEVEQSDEAEILLNQSDHIKTQAEFDHWWADRWSITDRQTQLLEDIATIAFGRSKIKAKP